MNIFHNLSHYSTYQRRRLGRGKGGRAVPLFTLFHNLSFQKIFLPLLVSLCLLSIRFVAEAAFVKSKSTGSYYQHRHQHIPQSSSTLLTMTWNTVFENNSSNLPVRSKWSEVEYTRALKFYDLLTSCQDKYLKHELHTALQCLENAYRLYGPENVIGSYNGGKDAVVILHLMRAVHASYYRKQISGEGKIDMIAPRVIYFENKDEFPEVLDLLQETVKEFELDMVAFSQDDFSFVSGLQVLVDQNQSCLAFVLGTRSSDPNAKDQGQFSPSSDWMPPFMRVNPVLDWSYGHVWHFLRKFGLPYCSLYDEGYTSLGSVPDTFPCPALAKPNGDGFWPAYMLSDWNQERAGRVDKKSSKKEDKAACSAKSATNLDTQNESISSSSSLSGISIGVQRTVALLIIGDEILKGQTSDTNTHAAAVAFRTHGVPLARVVVVPDELDEIVAEIRRLQKEVDIIVTSGGVGPTHDDVTIVSVGAALKSPLVIHEGMTDLLKEKMDITDGKLNEAQVSFCLCQVYLSFLTSIFFRLRWQHYQLAVN